MVTTTTNDGDSLRRKVGRLEREAVELKQHADRSATNLTNALDTRTAERDAATKRALDQGKAVREWMQKARLRERERDDAVALLARLLDGKKLDAKQLATAARLISKR